MEVYSDGVNNGGWDMYVRLYIANVDGVNTVLMKMKKVVKYVISMRNVLRNIIKMG